MHIKVYMVYNNNKTATFKFSFIYQFVPANIQYGLANFDGIFTITSSNLSYLYIMLKRLTFLNLESFVNVNAPFRKAWGSPVIGLHTLISLRSVHKNMLHFKILFESKHLTFRRKLSGRMFCDSLWRHERTYLR